MSRLRNLRIAAGVFLFAGVMLSTVANGQTDLQRLRANRLYLSQRRPLSPLADYVQAQALYVAAQGSFLESSARARVTRAEAVEQELENSVKWVETYFERKLLNQQYRKQLRPPRSVRQEASREQYENRMRQQPESFKRGDPTSALNWLLNKLSTRLAAHRVAASGDPLAGFDIPLSKEDVADLYFNDGSGKSPRHRFRNHATNVLAVEWPVIFKDTGFDPLRERYQTLSNQLLDAVANEDVRYQHFKALQETLDDLTTTLHTQFPASVRRQIPQQMKIYLAGKRFLEERVSTVFNAMQTNPESMLVADLGFDGLRIDELIRHMNSKGLFFANPEPTGLATYYRLFDYLREAYVDLR